MSPVYIPEKKLGKGGFGQVWLGIRAGAKLPATKAGGKQQLPLDYIDGVGATQVRLHTGWVVGGVHAVVAHGPIVV